MNLFYRIWYRLFGVLCECGCGTWKPKGKLCQRQVQNIISQCIDEVWAEQDLQPANPFSTFQRWPPYTAEEISRLLDEPFEES